MSTPPELLLWTALPNGVSGNTVTLSVFLAPQLTGTPLLGQSDVFLSQFPDWKNWPQTVASSPGGISFAVTFGQKSGSSIVPGATVTATNVTPGPPSGVHPVSAWAAIFNPAQTQVESFTFQDYSTRPVATYPVATIANFVTSLYGNLAATSPTEPIVVTGSLATGSDSQRNRYALTSSNPVLQQIYQELGALFPGPQSSVFAPATLTPSTLTPSTKKTVPPALQNAPTNALAALRTFQTPPSDPLLTEPVVPTLDFHQAITSISHYPAVLRLFSLVFDLEVTLPPGVSAGQVFLQVTPTFTPATGATPTNVSPWTAATLSSTSFRPTPQGPDYANGMLNLADTTRFTVTGLDTELATNRLDSLSLALQSGQAFHETNVQQNYFAHVAQSEAPTVSTAITVPALRTAGPQIIWTGFATSSFAGLSGQLSSQTALNGQLQSWLASRSPSQLPILYAEQVIRGHRFDLNTTPGGTATWRSLCGRFGQYTFGTPNTPGAISMEAVDEGVMIPGASQMNSASGTLPTLYVHESIARWNGWGLCAQRPGRMLETQGTGTMGNNGNVPVAPSSSGPSAPQLSAYFQAPSLAPSSLNGSAYLFPKLRFGSQYQFRARAVDLAGNSVPVTSTDSSTATPPFIHYRHEPVAPPVLAGMAPFVPGEATMLLVLLDDQVHTPVANGRWLFPPRTSEAMAEEHGMFDGFTLGHAPNANDAPSGAQSTYDIIANADISNLGDVTVTPYVYNKPIDGSTGAALIGTYDANNQNVPYFTGTPLPWTPWLPDPLSAGPALSGLPGLAAGKVLYPAWSGVWPEASPILLELQSGTKPSSKYKAASSGKPATINVTLPQAGVAVVRVSSALSANALEELGVWQWFAKSSFSTRAKQGQVWMLTPFTVLRMVHAVRLPLSAPALGSPVASRPFNSLSVDLADPEFQVDAPSTGHVDLSASWTDPVDDPSASAPTTITKGGPAFRLTIPDPTPTGPEAQPLTMVQNDGTFSFEPAGDLDTSGDNLASEQSTTHRIGDTKHHLVYYTATGTSRFAEMFATTQQLSLSTGTAVTLTIGVLGINVASLTLTINGTPLVEGVDYTLTTGGTSADPTYAITLLATSHRSAGTYTTEVTYQPVVTVTGAPRPVEVLASARPAPPVVSQVLPAWQIEGPSGSLEGSGITMERTGQFLRVYLERPWYSSGDGELLGVVTTVGSLGDPVSVFPTPAQEAWVTMMGLDPINAVQVGEAPWPVVPNLFEDLATVPDVPYRPPYATPPQVTLAEDPATKYQVWPYEVTFDESSQRWYADVVPRPGYTEEGIYPPPPGYFIRLALCRFQPYSIAPNATTQQAAEVSPVVLATFAQPVPDRSVSVVPNPNDPTGLSVLVSVTGPAYQGWRAPMTFGASPPFVTQYDQNNPNAPVDTTIYGGTPSVDDGKLTTSTMVVEVQIQNEVYNKLGLEGDLAWETTSQGPVLLPPTFSGDVYVTWGASSVGGGRPTERASSFCRPRWRRARRCGCASASSTTTAKAPRRPPSTRRSDGRLWRSFL